MTGVGKYIRKKIVYTWDSNLRINEEETIKQFGYSATTLSPKSPKRAVAICVKCGSNYIRQRQRIFVGSVCKSCSATNEVKIDRHAKGENKASIEILCDKCNKSFIIQKKRLGELKTCRSCDRKDWWSDRPIERELPDISSIVNEEETFKRFGYKSTDVRPTSGQHIALNCPVCKRLFQRAYRNVNKNIYCTARCHKLSQGIDLRALAKQKIPVVCVDCKKNFFRINMYFDKEKIVRCRPCDRKEWWTKIPLTEEYPDVSSVINEEETFKRFGFKSDTLRPASNKHVMMNCVTCKKLVPRRRCGVNTNNLCHSCSQRSKWESDFEGRTKRRNETMVERYGATGLPVFDKVYGKAELQIKDEIEKWYSGKVIRQYVLKNSKRLDLYFPEHKVAIEYNGLFWHHEKGLAPKDKYYHELKMRLAAIEGIKLISIFEDEWKSRPDNVINILKSNLGVYSQKIYARQCKVTVVVLIFINLFVQRHHLQGASRRAFSGWGLCFNNELVGAITMSKHHRQGHEGVVVLDRLCFKHGIQVIGGVSKLLKPFIKYAKDIGFNKIVSWSDNRWSNGNVYKTVGFILAELLPPDYSYVKASSPRERFSKQSQKKESVNCPDGMTEHEWAEKRGLVRIWDCGKKRWEIDLTKD